MNRRELVNAVAAHTGLAAKDVDTAIRGFTEVVTAVTAKGEPITITGFAKFAKVERKARIGRNPQTGEPVKIKASKKARITPLKAFKDSVMTPTLAPKLEKGVWPPAAKAAPVRKAAATKAPAKAAPAKAVAKKAPAKKAPAKKAPAKKAAR